MAPTQEEWDALSAEAREAVLAALPGPLGEDRIRFDAINAHIRQNEERIRFLEKSIDDAFRRAEEEARRREEEARLREEAEEEIARLRAELERLKQR